MHIPRLTALAELLDVTAPEKFDLCTWQCGSIACAVGTAACYSEFTGQGLTLEHGRYGTYPVLDFADGTSPLMGWDAVESFFDLTGQQSLQLFSNTAYCAENSGPADVAARIRKFINGNQS